MDKRNSKETLLKEIDRLKIHAAKVDAVFEAGEEGIMHVGNANYASREREALSRLRKIYYGED